MGRLSFPSRELNSATHQTDTRPLSPPIPPHRPLLHNHFRFRDGHTYSPIEDPPSPPPKEKGRGEEQRARRAPAAAARDSPGGDGCGGARAREGRRLLGKEGAEYGGRTRRGRGEGGEREASARARTLGARQTHTLTRTERARDTRRAGARGSGWPPPALPPLTLTRKWCCSLCSREPRFLHAPSLPPSPHWLGVEPRLREGGSAGNEKGGGREIAM